MEKKVKTTTNGLTNSSLEESGKGISRRRILKNAVWAPFLGSIILSSCKQDEEGTESKSAEMILPAGTLSPIPTENWYEFCRPILEWINPYPNIDSKAYVENLIRIAKEANVNTVYFVIDRGGSPLYQGSIEPADPYIGDFDLLGYLEKRLHEEGMYFVAAQFGTHTLSTLGERHPDWLMRDVKGGVIYGPGSVPQMCFNTAYSDYVGDELSRIVGKYRTDGIYIEGLYYTPKNCYCKSCKEKYRKLNGKPIPENIHRNDMAIAPFYISAITEFIDSINKKIKAVSPNTILMACPPVNRPNTHRVDWKKLSEVCDIITVEMMWGNRNVFPSWQMGMVVGIMQAESKKPCFTTAWYAIDVDREYTPRTKPTVQLNYFEPIINGATVQFHTQNALEEAPDNIPVLNELYSYTEKIRPYAFQAERIATVAILHDRDHLWPEDHFAGYYKALKFKQIPFKVISRDDINNEGLKETKVLVLPSIVRVTEQEAEAIKRFADEGGTVIATYKTGFQEVGSKTSTISEFLGVKNYTGEKMATRKVGENWAPEIFRAEHNLYFRCEKGSFADNATGISLLTYAGGLLFTEPTDDAKVLARTLKLDKSRQSPGNPILFGYHPGETEFPLILERNQGKGKVIYFAGELDKSFFEQGYDFISEILVKAVTIQPLPIEAEAPNTVSITYYKIKDKDSVMVHLLNGTTNQSLYPDPPSIIIPVRDIKIRIAGFKNVASINGSDIKSTFKNGYLNITIPELKVIDTIIIS